MDNRDAGGAKEAIETVKKLIRKECYKEASEWIKMTMEIYPTSDLLKNDGFGMLIISETLHYGYIHLSKCNDFDCYSILHLPPSSTQAEVEKRFNELKKKVIKIEFPGAKLAELLLKLANTALCQTSLRSIFDPLRKECVFFDWPTRPSNNTSSSSSSSFRESYLNWKPPIYRVDVTEHVQIWKRLELEHLSPRPHQPKEEEEKEKEKNPCLSPEMRILKLKVFDEMPQNPNYTPLEKYSGKVHEGMILGLELAFTKLCEEINNLVDVQSFWNGLDGFNEEISQLNEMGYNVEKVRERIDTLKRIAENERVSRAAEEKFEYEVRDREAKVINLQSRISDLQAEIMKSKVIIVNRKSKIETLKKDSSEDVAKFIFTAKSKWV